MKSDSKPSPEQPGNPLTRRRFMAGAAATAVTLSVVPPRVAWGSEANSKLKIGVIGCGGRGSFIAQLLQDHGGFQITAGADYFPDQVQRFGQAFKIEPGKLFSGLSGYKRLIESGVEAVAIESPPYFHPEQAAAAVDAGKHVYVAKPIAVDVPGCLSIEQSGRKARSKKQAFLIDFQTRATDYFIEAVQRVHQGALGELAFGEATYHAEDPFTGRHKLLQADPENPENRMRAWGLDRALSGDIITEQNIHTLDVMSWIMNQPPVSAMGTGGRAVRKAGSCWDWFTLVFKYPNNVGISFSSRQFFGHRTAEGIKNRMFGSKGVLETEYGGTVLIRSDDPYPGGKTPGIYRDGAAKNIATFHRDILAGQFENRTIEPSVQSNLVTILGRTAAYEKREVQWDDLLRNQQRLEPKLAGLKA